MEVMTSLPPAELHFGASPNITAPFTPLRFGTPFYSAPASPAMVSAAAETSTGNTAPFDWEEDNGDGFAFDFSGQLEKTSISPADELFEGGKIKPLIPPQGKENDSDLFPAAPSRSPEDGDGSSIQRGSENSGKPPARRSNSRRKSTRSLSPTPFRATQSLIDQDEPEIEIQDEKDCSSSFLSMWYRKLRLKDLLLFRSASEGRESGRGMMNRYAMLQKRHLQEDAKNSSFRSTESVGSTSSRRRGPLSAHELHYTLNRAASEEMKRKTFLPYKQGLFGCLGFHRTAAAAAVAADISKGIPSKSMPRSRHQ
ncbi:unnamed protein product [Cuscuta campestris]|uniref:Uncharacterized protein n=1 Tax=Cuscuta campestris TaxID=132261 RepID=A0A484L872_9ASTE|nr:unnamed protein product [Cuscuta campestris]